MAKLVFRYGAMGSSKSAQALVVRFNYIERGMHPLLLKPACENRDGELNLRSRIGLEAAVDYTVEDFLAKYQADPGILKGVDAVIVDEVQFLSRENIDLLSDIVDDHEIPVVCYGLRGDFQGNFFEGSKRLMEIADKLEEVPTICWCGHKARFNARIMNSHVVKEGEQVQLGGNESYVALCRKHFKLGQLCPEE